MQIKDIRMNLRDICDVKQAILGADSKNLSVTLFWRIY